MKGAVSQACFGRCLVDRCAVLSLEQPAAYECDILQTALPGAVLAKSSRLLDLAPTASAALYVRTRDIPNS